MAGPTNEPVILILIYIIEVVQAQKIYRSTTLSPLLTTTAQTDIPHVILFYASPVITLIILVLTVLIITHAIRACQRKFSRSTTSRIPTISLTVQDGTDADPPPPYTFTDIQCDTAIPKVSVYTCPPYTKDPPSYPDVTISTQS